jgi:hypothetical protein
MRSADPRFSLRSTTSWLSPLEKWPPSSRWACQPSGSLPRSPAHPDHAPRIGHIGQHHLSALVPKLRLLFLARGQAHRHPRQAARDQRAVDWAGHRDGGEEHHRGEAGQRRGHHGRPRPLRGLGPPDQPPRREAQDHGDHREELRLRDVPTQGKHAEAVDQERERRAEKEREEIRSPTRHAPSYTVAARRWMRRRLASAATTLTPAAVRLPDNYDLSAGALHGLPRLRLDAPRLRRTPQKRHELRADRYEAPRSALATVQSNAGLPK